MFFFLRRRRPPRSTRTDTRFTYTTLCRSLSNAATEIESARFDADYYADQVAQGIEGAEGRLAEANTRLANAERQLATAEERSEEHTSEVQSLMRISYAVFCLKQKTQSTI